LAKKYNHWATNLGEFLDFLAARRKSVLTSQWNGPEKRLTITVNLLSAHTESLVSENNEEKIRVRESVAGVAFPRTFEGEEVESVTLDQNDVSLKSIATAGSSTDRILKVPTGRHTIVVKYHVPADPTLTEP